MTNHTPEGLPPLPELAGRVYRIREILALMKAYAREALRAQAAGVAPVDDAQIVSAWSKHAAANDYPNGYTLREHVLRAGRELAKLYAFAPPAHVPADVVALQKLVAEAPVYFAPQHDFEGRKLAWIKRAEAVTQHPAPEPAQPWQSINDPWIVGGKVYLADGHSVDLPEWTFFPPIFAGDEPAQAVDARQLLIDAGRSIAWQCFGECRAFDEFGMGPVRDPGVVIEDIRAALAARQPQAQQGGGDALSIASEALEEIALAGMAGTGQESAGGMTDWHARQAWKFIGIAARAKTAIDAIATKEQRS